jgi:hypothetical protein
MQSHHQLVGRVARQGNQFRVAVYDLYAQDTADDIVRQIAESKEHISRGFIGAPMDAERLRVLGKRTDYLH